MFIVAHRVSRYYRQSSQISFSDSIQTQLSLTTRLEVATVAEHSSHQPTARCLLHKQHPGQLGGGKRLVPLGGELPRVHPVLLVGQVVVAAVAAAAVGGRHQQVAVGVLHGVEAQVLGHHRLRGDGVATQHLVVVVVVRGVQEAAVVGGEEGVQLRTRLDGVVRIRRRRAVGTCDGLLFKGCAFIHDQRLTFILREAILSK